MDKAEHWLRGSPIKALRDRGIAALLHGVETAACWWKSLMCLIPQDWRAYAACSTQPSGSTATTPLGIDQTSPSAIDNCRKKLLRPGSQGRSFLMLQQPYPMFLRP